MYHDILYTGMFSWFTEHYTKETFYECMATLEILEWLIQNF